VGNGPEIDIPYPTGRGAFVGNGGTGGWSLESDERDCCDIDGKFMVDPDNDLVRSRNESCDSWGEEAIAPRPESDVDGVREGAVVAVEPRRGFDRENSLGIRTEEDANLRLPTLGPLECALPW